MLLYVVSMIRNRYIGLDLITTDLQIKNIEKAIYYAIYYKLISPIGFTR